MTRYIYAAEQAKHIRNALKKAFPGVKFSVRSDRYSMGSSVDVKWLDGPTAAEVDRVLAPYSGKHFDGMIDLAYTSDSWLLPDGTAVFAGCDGTRGAVAKSPDVPRPHAKAERVCFSSYVHTQRVYTRAFVEQVAQAYHAETGMDIPKIEVSKRFVGGKEAGESAYFVSPVYGDNGHQYEQHLRTVSAMQPAPIPPAKTTEGDSVGYAVMYERDWTWVKFSAKPSRKACEVVGALGFTFSRKRMAWYATTHVDETTVVQAFAGLSLATAVSVSAVAISPTEPTVPAAPQPDPKLAEKFRAMCEKLMPKIEAKRNTHKGANLTWKRQREIESAAREADNMEQQQAVLLALAEAYEVVGQPEACVRGVRHLTTVEALVQDARDLERYGKTYSYEKQARHFGDQETYEAAVRWTQTVLNGVDTGDRDRQRQIARIRAEMLLRRPEGFFPTPNVVAEKMLEELDLAPGAAVLEPSAGAGDLADAVATRFPGVEITCLEVVHTLCQILEMKGYATQHQDFMEFSEGVFDAVVMNPPFERMQDVDHVMHAYTLLKPGGTLVSVMSESPFFSRNGRGQQFREWLDEVGGWDVDLPAGAFAESGTGVKTRYVVVRK
ncbi:MAG: methyltransferase [Anaerolinea sp.]|nr:methyltransferase [Anaerolinea sp.]